MSRSLGKRGSFFLLWKSDSLTKETGETKFQPSILEKQISGEGGCYQRRLN